MATGRIGVTPTLRTRWSKLPTTGTTVLSGLDDNSVALVYDVGYEAVYRNGVLLSRGNDYTATNGTTVTLIDATLAGDVVEIFANDLVPLTDAISKGQYNAKGALLSATAASTPAVLAVGTNDQVLTADSSTSTGLKWAAVNAGPVQLATASLAGVSTYTFSSISGSYKTLLLELKDSRDSSGEAVTIRINGTSSITYNYTGFTSTGSALTNTSSAQQFAGTVNANSISSSETSAMSYVFPNYSQTNIQKVYYGWGTSATSSLVYRIGNTGNTFQTSAITSLTVNNNAVNWVAGTLTLYGVN